MKRISSEKIQDIFSLTPMQEGMLFHYLENSQNLVYFEQLCLEIAGNIKKGIFKEAWQFVIDANEMLRAVFRWENIENPVQIILKEQPLQFKYYDISSKDALDRQKELEKIKIEDRQNQFDLKHLRVPFRIILCKIDKERFEIIISNHHILYDGWSNGIILNEFFNAYYKLIEGERLSRPAKTSFKEFVRGIKQRNKEKEAIFWQEYLKGYHSAAKLSIKRKKNTNIGNIAQVDSLSFMIPAISKKQLEFTLEKHKITLAAFLYCVWGLLLQRYNNCDDIIFGTTVAGRSGLTNIKDIESMVGLFINTLPLRVKIKPFETLLNLIVSINESLLSREEYASTPLVEINEYSELERREGLFDTLMVIENYPVDKELKQLKGDSAIRINHFSMWESTNFDLTVNVLISDQIEVKLIYRGESFARESIERMANHFSILLECLKYEQRIVGSIHEIDMLSENEKRELLFDFNETRLEYPSKKSIPWLILEQAKRYPDNTALMANSIFNQIYNGENISDRFLKVVHLSYKELELKSHELAQKLESYGLKNDLIVGVLMTRSLEMMIGLLGILKAGGAYLPLDPDYPIGRISYILRKSKPLLIVTESLLKEKIESLDFQINKGQILKIEELINRRDRLSTFPRISYFQNYPSSKDLSYVIFTSGSTGNPKGVMVQHFNVINFIIGMKERINFFVGKRLLSLTTICFDIFVLESWLCLVQGVQVVLGTEDLQQDLYLLKDTILSFGIDILQLTPSRLKLILSVDRELLCMQKLKELVVGGEEFPSFLFSQIKSIFFGKLYNVYGPTETTVWSTLKELSESESITIGIPIANTQIYILDHYNRLQPVGIPGELLIGGDGVVRGYLNNPELTAERFCLRRPETFLKKGFGTSKNFLNKQKFLRGPGAVFLKSAPGCLRQKLYKTGDLARWLYKGELEFLGRLDFQVKVHGFRIELEEIQEQLLSFDGVGEAVVISNNNQLGEAYLCAYLVWEKSGTGDNHDKFKELKDHLSCRLPYYMIPSYFMELEEIPLTPNGKLNRKQLPSPELKSEIQYIAPRDTLEEQLVKIWTGLFLKRGFQLPTQGIGIDDHFFQLGGHSLLAISLASLIHRQLNVKIPLPVIFKSSNIRSLSGYIREAFKEKYIGIQPIEKRDYYFLSSAQKRLYVIQQMDLESTVYNMPVVLPLPQGISKNELGLIFKSIIHRHESFRTSFHIYRDAPVQRIQEEVLFEIEEVEGMDFGIKGGRLKNFTRPFILSQAPLMRVKVVKLKEGVSQNLLFFDMHHIISDGLSQVILEREFGSLYQGKDLKPLRFQYKDFAIWQNHAAQKELQQSQGNYWRSVFYEVPSVLDLPIDYPRPSNQDFKGSCLDFSFSEEETKFLKELAKQTNTTLFMVLLSLYTILLSKISGQEDLVVGTPVSGRRHLELDSIIGVFINTLALRNVPNGEKIFLSYLEEVKEQTLQAFENQDYPFDELVDDMRIEPDIRRNPLFDVFFTIQNMEFSESVLKNREIEPYFENIGGSKFDLTLRVIEKKNNLSFGFEYKTTIFQEQTIHRFVIYFRRILLGLIENSKVQLYSLELMTEAEKKQILENFNDTDVQFPDGKAIHRLFEDQVKFFSDRVSVELETNHLSYKELNTKANQLALRLLKEGLQSNAVVGIILERSLEMLIAVFGVLKAGCGYLPIDLNYPLKRIGYILQDSSIKYLLTQSNLKAPLGIEHKVFNLKDKNLYSGSAQNLEKPTNLKDVAYVIYTSGSTGNPKGVIINHRSLTNVLYRLFKEYPFLSKDIYLLKTSFVFDVSVTELFGWFLGAGRLTILKKDGEKDPEMILNAIESQHVTHINFVPSLFNYFVGYLSDHSKKKLSHLKYIFLAGEEVKYSSIEKFRRMNDQIKLENLYGPTEGTIYSSKYSIERCNEKFRIPIGIPLANVKMYIYSQYFSLQAIGIPGELWIGGLGLSRGYLNRVELTSEKFRIDVGNEFYLCLYRSGDLARWLEDGNIDFLGRIDSQVKVRGFRIELGEIENSLLSHSLVKDAAVIVNEKPPNDKFLCGYVVLNTVNGLVGVSEQLREFLGHSLPSYMIPNDIVVLEKMPLTSGGKISRLELPELKKVDSSNYQPAINEIEYQLMNIWGEVLGIEREKIGRNANFFQLGGHSLKATIVAGRIHRVLNIEVPLSEIFKRLKLCELADFIKQSKKENFTSIKPVEKREYYLLSSAQKRLFFMQQMEPESVVYNIPIVIPLYKDIDIDELEKILRVLIHRHESFRTSFFLKDDEPVQRIHHSNEIEFKIDNIEEATNRSLEYKIDCSLKSGENHDGKQQTLLFQDIERLKGFIRPFNLSQVPLLRVGVYTGKISKHNRKFKNYLMIDMHHIISDGTSLSILQKDFMSIFNDDSTGSMVPFPIQYKDFAYWQMLGREKDYMKEQENFWMEELSGELPVLTLPLDFPRPAIQNFAGDRVNFQLSSLQREALKALCQTEGLTLYMMILSIVSIWLSKLSNQEDILIGTPIANRRHVDLEKIIGMFVNTLIMRNFPIGDMSFRIFLHELKNRSLRAFENQDYQFDDLVEKVSLQRETNRNPIFDVMVNLINHEEYNQEMNEILFEKSAEIERVELQDLSFVNSTSKFDLNLTAYESAEGLNFSLEYSIEIFKPETIKGFVKYFKNIVQSIINDSCQTLYEIEILDCFEKSKILEISNGPEEYFDRELTIHYWFERIASIYRDEIALVYQDSQLSYQKLDQRSAQLADLLHNKGAYANVLVGVMLTRSIELIVGVLGILKAGGAYLPIDEDLPSDRKKYMLKDSGTHLILYNKDENLIADISGEVEVIDLLDENNYSNQLIPINNNNIKSDLLYVIYTSGTTGKPKGVMLEHQNLTNLFYDQYYYTDLVCQRILQFATISFDASFHEIFSALLCGGCLFLIDGHIRSHISELFQIIETNQINTLFLPMSFLKMLFGEREFIRLIPSCIKHIQTAGEQVILSNGFKDYLKDHQIFFHNHYGPTETHVVTTLTLEPQSKKPDLPPIGKPILNTSIYILDSGGNLLPVGITGELFIGGIQVGRGYLNNPELTAERFNHRFAGGSFYKNHPLHPRKNFLYEQKYLHDKYETFIYIKRENSCRGESNIRLNKRQKLYRTGDLCRRLLDKNIEFLGRKDCQVKIRGFRIELSEIEFQLENLKYIKEAVVIVREEKKQGKMICAYIVWDLTGEKSFKQAEIRDDLSKKLPEYMIPSYFMQISKIPLTANGKVDRKSLPIPDIQTDINYVAPRSEIERKLVRIWAEILGIDAKKIGINDSFFALGGQSLNAFHLIFKIHQYLKIKIPLKEIFKRKTIKEIEEFIFMNKDESFESIEPLEKKEYYEISSSQKRLFILNRILGGSTVYNMPAIWKIKGILSQRIVKTMIMKLIERHESLRTTFPLISNEPVQRIHENLDFNIEYHDCSQAENNPVQTLSHTEKIKKNFIRLFDLSKDTLFRLGLIKESEEKFTLMIDMHHIISDGVSIGIILKEILHLFEDTKRHPLLIQYKDFTHWHNRFLQSKKIIIQEQYWLQMFEDGVPLLNFPTDYPRPKIQSFNGDKIHFQLDSDLANKIKELARKTNTTVNMVFLSVLKVLLSKYSGRSDMVIGMGITGRNHPLLENIIGAFINTLAIRSQIQIEESFDSYLEKVMKIATNALENQDYPFDELVDKLNFSRDMSRNPLFDVLFIPQLFEVNEFEVKGLKFKPTESIYQNSHVDLVLYVMESANTIKFILEYVTDLFKHETIERMSNRFIEILEQIAQSRDIKINDIKMSHQMNDVKSSEQIEDFIAFDF